jgi:hypothetical protein
VLPSPWSCEILLTPTWLSALQIYWLYFERACFRAEKWK